MTRTNGRGNEKGRSLRSEATNKRSKRATTEVTGVITSRRESSRVAPNDENRPPKNKVTKNRGSGKRTGGLLTMPSNNTVHDEDDVGDNHEGILENDEDDIIEYERDHGKNKRKKNNTKDLSSDEDSSSSEEEEDGQDSDEEEPVDKNDDIEKLPDIAATDGRGSKEGAVDIDDDDDTSESKDNDSVVVLSRGSGGQCGNYTNVNKAKSGNVRNYVTLQDKVDMYEKVSLGIVIRENLYPYAKIIFNSDTELALDGKICNLIFKHMRMDGAYENYSERKKKEHKNHLWSVWRDLVSRNLDQKRHNQKGQLKKIFWTWFEDSDDDRNAFPTCEHLLRDNWFVASPIPQSINDGRPEQEQLDATYCDEHSVVNSQYIQMLLRMGKTVVGVETWKQRGENHCGNFEDMLYITDEILIAWTIDGQYNGWCHEYGKRSENSDSTLKKKRGRGSGDTDDSSPADTASEEENRNRMASCKQQPSADPEDWLNFERPLTGPWFIRKNMDAGFTRKHGGTTEFGKNRWNEWGKRIAERRRSKNSEDPAVKQKYRLFCLAFQDAWKEMYQKRSRSAGGSDDGRCEYMEAFNGIDWE